METQPSRTIKTHTPVGLVAGVVIACALLLAGIYFALNHLQKEFNNSRLTGIITAKEFESERREEITIGEVGLHTRNLTGDHVLTVRVPRPNEEPKEYKVWVPESIYHTLEVGDSFDVGPYLVPDGS